MNFFTYWGRFIQGVRLFLKVLLSYKLHSLRNIFASPAMRDARLRRLHASNARMLRERMIAMRGVLIKIGQFMSSRVDILPEEYTDELSKLQLYSKCMSYLILFDPKCEARFPSRNY